MGDALDDVLGDVLGDNVPPAQHPAVANPLVGAGQMVQLPEVNTIPGTRIKLWNVFLVADRVEVYSQSMRGWQKGVVTEVLNKKTVGKNGVEYPVTEVTAMYGDRMKKVYAHDTTLPKYFKHVGKIPPAGYVLPPGWMTRDSGSTGMALYIAPGTSQPSFEWPPSAGAPPAVVPPQQLVHLSSFGGAAPPQPDLPKPAARPPQQPVAPPPAQVQPLSQPAPPKPAPTATAPIVTAVKTEPKPKPKPKAKPKPKPKPKPTAAAVAAAPAAPPKPRKAERPVVHNIMASCNLGCAVDLTKFAIYGQVRLIKA